MLRLLIGSRNCNIVYRRCCSTIKEKVEVQPENPSIYETVFSFPFIKYVALFQRLKVYHLTGTSIAIPGCGLMEIMDVLPPGALYAAAYIGVTGTAVLSLFSLPFKNIIGYLYIRVDNQKIKISSVDFWGKRKDRIVKVDDWCPLLDIQPKTLDALYLSPQLSDGTKYKLFVKFGNVLDAKRMGEVLE